MSIVKQPGIRGTLSDGSCDPSTISYDSTTFNEIGRHLDRIKNATDSGLHQEILVIEEKLKFLSRQAPTIQTSEGCRSVVDVLNELQERRRPPQAPVSSEARQSEVEECYREISSCHESLLRLHKEQQLDRLLEEIGSLLNRGRNFPSSSESISNLMSAHLGHSHDRGLGNNPSIGSSVGSSDDIGRNDYQATQRSPRETLPKEEAQAQQPALRGESHMFGALEDTTQAQPSRDFQPQTSFASQPKRDFSDTLKQPPYSFAGTHVKTIFHLQFFARRILEQLVRLKHFSSIQLKIDGWLLELVEREFKGTGTVQELTELSSRIPNPEVDSSDPMYVSALELQVKEEPPANSAVQVIYLDRPVPVESVRERIKEVHITKETVAPNPTVIEVNKEPIFIEKEVLVIKEVPYIKTENRIITCNTFTPVIQQEPVELVREVVVEKVVERVVEKERYLVQEKIVPVDRVVERLVERVGGSIVTVCELQQKIVERRVEVPVDREVEKEVLVIVEVEVVRQRPVLREKIERVIETIPVTVTQRVPSMPIIVTTEVPKVVERVVIRDNFVNVVEEKLVVVEKIINKAHIVKVPVPYRIGVAKKTCVDRMVQTQTVAHIVEVSVPYQIGVAKKQFVNRRVQTQDVDVLSSGYLRSMTSKIKSLIIANQDSDRNIAQVSRDMKEMKEKIQEDRKRLSEPIPPLRARSFMDLRKSQDIATCMEKLFTDLSLEPPRHYNPQNLRVKEQRHRTGETSSINFWRIWSATEDVREEYLPRNWRKGDTPTELSRNYNLAAIWSKMLQSCNFSVY